LGRPLSVFARYHALLWAIHKPRLLSKLAASVIEKGELVVSAASLWELLVKKDKADAPVLDPTLWWQQHVTRQGVTVLPMHAYHFKHLQTLPPFHRDPFDRILISQAIHEGFRIVTCDEAVRRYHEFAGMVW
jgi:PIN domain nuclease of toxin-antitoxin system